MNNITVLTDCTENLPAKWVEQYAIRIIPLKSHWGNKTCLGGL